MILVLSTTAGITGQRPMTLALGHAPSAAPVHAVVIWRIADPFLVLVFVFEIFVDDKPAGRIGEVFFHQRLDIGSP